MLIKLSNRALLKVTGPDATNFLNSQFSNDVKNLTSGVCQINSYCQHQGKIISIIWVMKKEDFYFISIPEDVFDIVLSKLRMFKLMSNVDIKDFSSEVYQYGVIDENIEGSFILKNYLSVFISSESIADVADINNWENACIENLIPEIYLINSEKYIPQMLNLDIDEFGVSFNKGCYPGQEVIARMHYLGKPKRRLYLFSSDEEAKVGDKLNVENSVSLKPSGEVIRISKQNKKYLFLGIVEVKHIEEPIFLNNNNEPLNIINA